MQSSFLVDCLLFILIIAIIITLYRINSKMKCTIPHNNFLVDDPVVMKRFQKLMSIWKKIAADKDFCVAVHRLLDTNSTEKDTINGSKRIADAYSKLHHYIAHNINMPSVRITLIYTDGIVFYDSVLKMNNVYYMDKNHLPKPLSMYTLGSPLKNHNTLPEIANSLIVNDASDACLNNIPPVYKELIHNGFGFYERMSSSLDKPFSYVAKFLTLPYPFKTHFKDGCSLRVGLEIDNDIHNKFRSSELFA